MISIGCKVGLLFQVFALAAVGLLGAEDGLALCATGPTATYQFVGQCAPNDCTGTGTGLLTLQNYTLGNSLSTCNFVSFSYQSNLESLTIARTDLTFFSGTLPNPLPAAANVTIEASGAAFASNSAGFWCANCRVDTGLSSTWSLAVPTSSVPAVSVPMLIGLAVMLGLIGAAILLRGIPKRRAD